MGRSVKELHGKAQSAAVDTLVACKAAGLEVLISCTYRSPEEQDALYAQGRTKPGAKVTNARAYQSFHQYRVALDVYPVVHGKPDFSGKAPEWPTMAAIFKKHGFEWGFDWPTFKEMPHFQMTGGHSLAYFRAGGEL